MLHACVSSALENGRTNREKLRNILHIVDDNHELNIYERHFYLVCLLSIQYLLSCQWDCV